MTGWQPVFAGLFGAPLAATFALEVLTVRVAVDGSLSCAHCDRG